MAGTPVWLCSISRTSPITGGILPTGLWSSETITNSAILLRRMLASAGNPHRERLFRMNITLCLHRAITPAESRLLPRWFHDAEAVDLAGGPVEVLWESETGSLSTQPCHAPSKQPLDSRNPMLWLPIDCHQCPPCRARMAVDRDLEAKTAGLPAYLDRYRLGEPNR